ncbi:MAG: serine/threonine-protein kinase [Gemmataceae bacterium]
MVVPSGSPEPMPSGRMLGKYRLLRKLGAGGMGVVFLAQDTVLDRQVALKTLSGRISTHKAFVNRFLREARAAARLSHPNVVPIFDVLPHEQTAFLVMEYLPGGSVQDRLLRHGALPWLEAVSLVTQAGRGLQAAHEAGLVHCDVKPANLLVGRNGDIKVADFGLVKVLDPEQSPLNTPAQVLGTPHFMSPEQCRGESIDPRSDVYSLAATLYTLVTGTVPFSADNTYARAVRPLLGRTSGPSAPTPARSTSRW